MSCEYLAHEVALEDFFLVEPGPMDLKQICFSSTLCINYKADNANNELLFVDR